MTENNFCVRHKNNQEHNQHFKLLFFKRKLDVGPPNYIHTCIKNKNIAKRETMNE